MTSTSSEGDPPIRIDTAIGREHIKGGGEEITTPPPGEQKPVTELLIDPPIISDEPISPVDLSMRKKIAYILPFAILLIGVIAYFIIMPNLFGRGVSFIEWLFSGPQNIVDTLRDSDGVLLQIHWIIGVRILWVVWLVCFIASLFWLGKKLHAKPEPDAPDAIMTKREPYLLAEEIRDTLNHIKQRQSGQSDKQFDAFIYKVKILVGKLEAESDFGYGKRSVIIYENNIARQLKYLKEQVSSIENSIEEWDRLKNASKDNIVKNMDTAVESIETQRSLRKELKKK